MAIKYCDYAAGNDTTGDGTAGNPYKTIDKASTGATGGDEVRCAKSAAPSAIGGGGNWQWTDGSTSVVIAGDYSTDVAAKDFITKNVGTDCPWEVSSIAYAGGNTTITLVATYSGTTEAVATYKLGVTDTGTAAATGTNVQSILASGTAAARLMISGGWNLGGTPAQDGVTWFWQSGTPKYGTGLYATGKSFIEIDGDRLGFLRYYRGLYSIQYAYQARATGWLITDLSCISCDYCGYDLERLNETISGGWVVGTLNTGLSGLYLAGTDLSRVSGLKLLSNYRAFGTGGGAMDAVLSGCLFRRNSNRCMTFSEQAGRIALVDCALEHCPTGIYAYANVDSICLVNCTLTSVTTPVSVLADLTGVWPCVKWQHYNGIADDNRIDFVYGSSIRNTADARSGACWKFSPTDATYTISSYNALRTWAAADTNKDLTVYLKQSGTYTAGDVALEAYDEAGRLVAGPTAQTVATSYGQHTLTVAAANIPEAQVLTLRLVVKRASGADLAVFVDDFMAA